VNRRDWLALRRPPKLGLVSCQAGIKTAPGIPRSCVARAAPLALARSKRCPFRDAIPDQKLCRTVMEFMIENAQRNQCTHIEKEFHGKSARICCTCLWVSLGAWGPAVKTGKPVTGSLTIRARCRLPDLGVKIIRPDSTLASSESPAWRPSVRRTRTGKTTWPLVDTLVCMVR
jgi:hypothetical protein